MKRKRSDELELEYERQVGNLNRTFFQWLESNQKANPFATWEEGCQDYVTHAEQLRAKYCTAGTVAACGTGDCGQLGFGVDHGDTDMFVNRLRVNDTLRSKSVGAVACGGMHNAVVCAEDGVVWSWGCSDDGSLGREGDENYPAPVTALQAKAFVVGVSAGDCHTVALTLTGQVYIWGAYKDKDGRNWFRAASGEEAFRKSQSVPVLVDEVSNVAAHGGVTQIASGASHTLALCGDGTVYSWGIDEAGQLGRKVCDLKDERDVYQKDLVLHDHLTPRVMTFKESGGPVSNARYVAAGSHHSFVLLAVRSRVCACGLNQYGQLALPAGTLTDQLVPVPALNELGINSIYGGEHSSMALTHEGQVYTFGRADSNQLGVELVSDNADEPGAFTCKPQLVKFDPPAKIASAACGTFHCAAISQDGALYTWGFGDMSQLGHGRSKDEPRPRKVEKDVTGTPVRAVMASAGGQHTVVILSE